MNELTDWPLWLQRQACRAPLKFVNGVRHSVPAGYYCPPHSHPTLEIVYHPVGRGKTRLSRRGINLSFQERSVIIYDAREEHDQRMETEGEDLCVLIELPAKQRFFPQGCLHLAEVESPALIEDLRLLSHGYARLNKGEQAEFNFRATATLLALVNLHGSTSRRQAASPAEGYILKAEEYVGKNLFALNGISEIAEAVGISPHYLRHLFKSRRGKSLIRHVNEMRIDRAKSLLSHSRLPLKQIASLCGFRDEYYFSTTFRSIAHCAPGRYRMLSGDSI